MTSVPSAPPTKPRDVRASLPRLDRHKPRGGAVRPSKMGRRRAWFLIGIHVLIGLHFLHWGLTGASVTPVEPSEAMETVELGKLNAGFLFFAALIAGTLVFGRWFCGWACHIVALQDLCAWLLGKVGLRPRPVRSRLLVFAPFVVAFYMFGWPIVHHWWDPVEKPLPGVSEWQLQLTKDDLWETFPQWIMGPLTLLVVGFLIVWWLGAKGFCTHGCPYGAIFSVADRVAPMRIVVNDSCEGCGHCTAVCSSNVRVHEEVAKHGQIVDPGCMKCLDCVSVCPKEALSYGKAWPKPFAVSQQRIAARADFSWPEEILLAVVAFVAVQFVFRGAWFGEGVPLLLAVGLGAITAVFTLLFVRLLSRRDLAFQHSALKKDRRLTRRGWIVLALLGLWLAFAGHTWVAQSRKASAIEAAREPLGTLYMRTPETTQSMIARAAGELPAALERVDAGLSWDLVDDPSLLEYRGLLLHAMDRHVQAEAALSAALRGRKGLSQALSNIVLARYCMDPARKRYERAEQLLEFTIEHHPGNLVAENLLRQLRARGK